MLALGQEADLTLLDGIAGIEVDGGVVRVGEDMMTGCPGVFAGGDMVPDERTVTAGIGHGKQAARCMDAWLRGEAFVHAAAARGRSSSRSLNTWYYADAPKTVPPAARPRPPGLDLRRGRPGARRVDGALRGAPLPVVRQLLRLRQLLRDVPRQRRDQARRPGEPYAYEIDLDFCKGCGICAAECPCGAIEMQPETI